MITAYAPCQLASHFYACYIEEKWWEIHIIVRLKKNPYEDNGYYSDYDF
jgi:hypothetical protein